MTFPLIKKKFLNCPSKNAFSFRSYHFLVGATFKDIFQWNIFQMITKIDPISTRMIKSSAMKRIIPPEVEEKSRETEKTK